MSEFKHKLVANYIAKLATEFDWRVFTSSFWRVTPVVNRVVVVHAPGGPITDEARKRLLFTARDADIIEYEQPVTSFAALRNLALSRIAPGEFLYWIDADEVPFSQDLLAVRGQIDRDQNIVQVRTRFVHFCISPCWYERMEPRNTIVQKEVGTHWECSVHERLAELPTGRVLHSDMIVHHYGYCKPQHEIFKHWQHYAELEGDPNRYINEEVAGKTVPYFRPGERPSPDHVLTDRIKTLLPYTGQYPDLALFSYLKSVCPSLT